MKTVCSFLRNNQIIDRMVIGGEEGKIVRNWVFGDSDTFTLKPIGKSDVTSTELLDAFEKLPEVIPERFTIPTKEYLQLASSPANGIYFDFPLFNMGDSFIDYETGEEFSSHSVCYYNIKESLELFMYTIKSFHTDLGEVQVKFDFC